MATRIKTLRIRITARDRRTLDALLGEHRLDVLEGGARPRADGTVSIEALVPDDQVKRLRKLKVTIAVLDKDAGATGRARQKEVGKGNPFGETGVPRGLGRKVKEGGHGLP
jgi:hypothetical protein